MSRGVATQRVNNFQNGLVTEATGLSFPENSLRDVVNCDIDIRGSIRRRLGLQREPGSEGLQAPLSENFPAGKYGFFSHVFDGTNPISRLQEDTSVATEDVAITVHEWKSVANRGDLNFLVIQVGTRLYVFDHDDEAVIRNLKNKGIKSGDDLTNANVAFNLVNYSVNGGGVNGESEPKEALGYRAHGDDMSKSKLDSASGFGRIWFVGSAYYPFYLEFKAKSSNPREGTILLRMLGQDGEKGIGELTIRDFNGVEDVVTDSENLTLTGLKERDVPIPNNDGSGDRRHMYNLLNQGWGRHHIIGYKRVRGGQLPNNTQIWFVGRKGNGVNWDQVIFTDWGDTPAPKGRAKLDALYGGFGDYGAVTPSPVGGESGFSLYVWADSRSVNTKPESNGEVFGVAHSLRRAVKTALQNLGIDNTSSLDGDAMDAALANTSGVGTVFEGSPSYVHPTMIADFGAIDGLYNFPSDGPIQSNGQSYVAPGENEVATRAFTTAAFFAGRLWISGDDNPGRPGGIYFSKVITKPIHASMFHQVNDPTSEDFSELLPDDGGVIYIPEAGKVTRLEPFASGVLVFGSNGVWFISGGQENFAADKFSVDKLSSTKVVGRDAVVNAIDKVMFWSEDGIYMASIGDAALPVLQELTEQKIASFFNNISDRARQNAWGVYDPISRKIFWNYLSIAKDDEPDTLLQSFYDSVLVLDARTGAFYPYTHNLDTSTLRGVGPSFPRRTQIKSLLRGGVVVNGEQVVVEGEEVTTFEEADEELVDAEEFLTGIKQLWIDGTGLRIEALEYTSLSFLDYVDIPLVPIPSDYSSHFITGDVTVESPEVFKQATYLHSFFQKTESGVEEDSAGNLVFIRPSGCMVTAQWDWHRSDTGNRWSNPQKAYRFRRPFSPLSLSDTVDTGDSIVYTRLKIRGKGRALNLRYESEPGKDFKLFGYSVNFTANAT